MNLLNIIEKTKDVISDLSSGESTGIPYKMQNLLGDMIITPNIIVTDTCKDYECFADLCKFQVELFASFMVQTFTVLTEAYGLSAPKLLNVVKTNHNTLDGNRSVASHVKYLFESDNVNSIFSELRNMDNDPNNISGIGNKIHTALSRHDTFGDKLSQPYLKYEETKTKASSNATVYNVEKLENSDFIKKLNKTNIITMNLSINGEQLNNNQKTTSKVTLPITIMPNFVFVTEQQLVDGLFDNHQFNSISARWLAYQAGEISFLDLLFASDLIRKYKKKQLIKNPLNDIKNTSREIEAINKGGRLLQYLSSDSKLKELVKNPNFSPYYNMLIVDKDTKERLDKEIGSDTLDFRGRDILLNKIFGLSYTVVDQDFKLIDFGIDGIKAFNTISWKKLKNDESQSTDKIVELMSTLLMSKTVTI